MPFQRHAQIDPPPSMLLACIQLQPPTMQTQSGIVRGETPVLDIDGVGLLRAGHSYAFLCFLRPLLAQSAHSRPAHSNDARSARDG